MIAAPYRLVIGGSPGVLAGMYVAIRGATASLGDIMITAGIKDRPDQKQSKNPSLCLNKGMGYLWLARASDSSARAQGILRCNDLSVNFAYFTDHIGCAGIRNGQRTKIFNLLKMLFIGRYKGLMIWIGALNLRLHFLADFLKA